MTGRRSFFKTLFTAAGAGLLLLRAPAAHAKKFALKLAQVPKLKAPGGAATIKLAGRQILLARVSESKMVAVAAECTHQKCYVAYDAKRKRIACGCHGSFFDLSGKVLNGPATADLAGYPVQIDGDRIIVTVE